MRRKPTGSKVHRIWKCPPSWVLPQVYSDEVSPAAGHGVGVHSFLERVSLVGQEQALGELRDPRVSLLARCLDLASLPTHLATEVAIAWDWRARRGRELGRNIGRPYAVAGGLAALGIAELGPTEIGLCIDLVGVQVINGIRLGYAGDWKTGHSRYPTPDKYGQTLLAAIALRSVYNLDECVVELIFLHSDGTHHMSRGRLDDLDMDEFSDQLEAAFDDVGAAERALEAGRGVDVTEGGHCQFCEAFNSCPAKRALVLSMPRVLSDLGIEPKFLRSEPGVVVGIRPGVLTRDQIPDAWAFTERVEEAIAALRSELCNMAASGGEVAFPDGRVLGPCITERETLDGPIAAGVLHEQLPDRAAKAIEISVSKEAIRRIVVEQIDEEMRINPDQKRPVISSKHGTGVLDGILAAIRGRGGAGISRSEAIKPHQPRRSKKS